MQRCNWFKQKNTLLSALRCAMLCVAAFAAPYSFSESECNGGDENCIAAGSWDVSIGIGVGVRTNPIVDRDDLPLLLIPSVRYYGQRFFLENLNLGYLLFDSKQYELNVLFSPSEEHMFFNSLSLGNFTVDNTNAGAVESANEFNVAAPDDYYSRGETIGSPQADIPLELAGPNLGDAEQNLPDVKLDNLHKRGWVYRAGFEYQYYADAFLFNIQALRDISGEHDGLEIRAGFDYEWVNKRSKLTVGAGALWQDESVLNYYYGVEEDEVSNRVLIFKPESGFSPFIRADWVYNLNKNWSLVGNINLRKLSSSVKDSPLVEQNHTLSTFVGGVYHF